MGRPNFRQLYRKIISKVWDYKFKSKQYIDEFLIQHDNPLKSKIAMIYTVHLKESGGYVYGEVKLVITLHMMASGDALYSGALFDISPNLC